jgi:hypothetical protein
LPERREAECRQADKRRSGNDRTNLLPQRHRFL